MSVETFKTLADEFAVEVGKNADLCAQAGQTDVIPEPYEHVTPHLSIALEALKKRNVRAASYARALQSDLSVQLPRFKTHHKIVSLSGGMVLTIKGKRACQIVPARRVSNIGVGGFFDNDGAPSFTFDMGSRVVKLDYYWNDDGSVCTPVVKVVKPRVPPRR